MTSRLFVIILSLLLFFSPFAYAAPDNAVRIAVNLPLSGELATYGSAVQEGVLLAMENLERSSSTPQTFDFDWQDNRGSAREAVLILKQQLMHSPSLYISGIKPQYMAIKDELEKSGIPNFAWIFDVSIRNSKQSNFRTFVNFKIEPPVFLEYAKRVQARRAAVIYVQLPHTDEEYKEIIIPGLKSQGINEILVDAYQLDKQDFRDIALRIKTFNPDLIILSGFQVNLVSLVKSLRQLALIKDGNLIATYDMLDAANLLSANETEGIWVVAPRFITRQDDKKVQTWTQDFRKRFNKSPIYTNAYAYDMAMIIANAAGRVKKPASSSDWINALRLTDMDGITGPLRFDGDGDLRPQVETGVFRNGVVSPES